MHTLTVKHTHIIKQKRPAVAKEDALQPTQLLLQSIDLQGHPKSTTFMSFERQYATSY